MPRKTPAAIAFIAIALALALPAAFGQSLDELQQRFKQRYPALLTAKREGRIGETADGLVEFVRAEYRQDKPLVQLLDEENADRRVLYRLIAERENVTPQVVAQRNAARNFDKAVAGQYLRGRDGQWYQKR